MTYGPDAVYVATEIYKSVTCLKHIGQGKSNYITTHVMKHSFCKMLR